ncbi:hypothetical protein HGRIS_009237 [Hohenbuehelia grisea]|uniref:Secreted protein n=1 Tax=Hohenbuehelia grisea TaxID=104357 RepID=A0ABR3J0I2_9AGAR
MLQLLLLSALAALLFLYTFVPSFCLAVFTDDHNAHEAGLAAVAARNPFRESGPPVCMAKLIMLRHKIHQTNTRRRRSTSRPRPLARPTAKTQPAPLPTHTHTTKQVHAHPPPVLAAAFKTRSSWMHMRFGKTFGKQNH